MICAKLGTDLYPAIKSLLAPRAIGGGTGAAWAAVLGVSAESTIWVGEAKGSLVLKTVLALALSDSGVGRGFFPCWLIVRFIADTGILSRPDGDDANPWPDEADTGILVARDRLGRPLSPASPLWLEPGEPPAAELVGEELMWRWDEICCNDGSRVIRGLVCQKCP